jgi:tetratricopeptide (TPR) repeat protein
MRIELTRRLPLLCAAAGLWLALPAPAGIVVLQNAPVYLVEFGPAERVEPFGSLPQFASTYLHLRLAAIQGARVVLIREQPVCGANTLPPPPQNEEQASARRSVPAPQVTSYVVSGTLRRKPGDHEDALELSYELIKRTDCRPETLLKQSSTFDPDELLTRLSVVSDEIANSLADSISNKAIVLVSEIDGGAKDAGTLQQLLLDTLSDSKAFRGQQSVAPPRVAGYIVEGKLSAISGRNLKARYTLELTAVAGKERYPLTSGSGGPFADERQLYRYYIGEVRKAVSRLETVHYQRQVGLSSEYSKTPDAEILQKSREALCEPRKTGCEPKPEIALALLEERLDRLQPADEAYTLASRAYRLAGQDVAAAELHERRLAQVRAPGQRQQILIAAGDAWMQAHEYGRAAERYQQALALSRESGDSVPEVIGKRARALRLDDKPAEALKFLLDNRKDSASWEDEIAEELAGLRSISQLQPICTTLRQRLGTASLATGQCLARLGRLQSADENYVEAAANLRQAAEILGGRKDADEVWATLASTEREASHYEAAAAAAGRALDLRVAAYGASSSQAADTETLLGTIYAQWQKLPEAKSHLENAIAIYDKLPDVNEIDLVRALDWLGHAEQEATHVDAAERADRRALAILRKQSAAYSSWQADSLQKLGDLAKLRADFRVAEDYYRQSLQLREKDGPGSAEHLYSQYLLADALMELGRFVEARNLYTSVLEGRKKLGVEPDYIAQSYGALGLMYSQWGMYPESETNWRLSLDFRLKVPKPSARAVEMVRYSLGATLGQLGRYAEGERLLRQGFEAQVAEYGRGEFGHAASEKNLGLILMLLGRYKEARNLIQESIDIRSKFLGAGNPITSISLDAMALWHAAQRDYDSAETLFRQALQAKETGLPANHWLMADDLVELGKLLTARSRHQEAEPYYRRVIEIWTAAENPDHPQVAASQNGLALLEGERGNLKRMEELCNQSLTLRTKVLGPGHPDVAQSNLCLAAFQERSGNPPRARQYYIQARDVLTRALGGDHPQLAYLLRDYASFLTRQGLATEAAAAEVEADRIRASHAAREAGVH